MASDIPLSHDVEGLEFPSTHPPGFEATEEDDKFDPAVHLALKPPAWVRPLLRTDDDAGPQDFPLPIKSDDESFPGLAFSAPFQLLSEAGVAAFQRCVDVNEHHAKANNRQPKSMRCVGYRSEFSRSLAYDPSVLEALSSMCGKSMWPEDHASNNPQVNFGVIGEDKPVDRWHLDSVPYVIVLILSDVEEMVGGELKVARLADPKKCLALLKDDALPESKIESVVYPKAGWAIFMQGSKIAHTVTPVVSAREPRRTAIFSYQPRDCFAPDAYVYRSYKGIDPLTLLEGEHARHVAWRVRGQLSSLVSPPLWGQQEGGRDRQLIRQVLRNCAAELSRAEALMAGTLEEDFMWQLSEAEVEAQKKLEAELHKVGNNKRDGEEHEVGGGGGGGGEEETGPSGVKKSAGEDDAGGGGGGAFPPEGPKRPRVSSNK